MCAVLYVFTSGSDLNLVSVTCLYCHVLYELLPSAVRHPVSCIEFAHAGLPHVREKSGKLVRSGKVREMSENLMSSQGKFSIAVNSLFFWRKISALIRNTVLMNDSSQQNLVRENQLLSQGKVRVIGKSQLVATLSWPQKWKFLNKAEKNHVY